MQCLDDNVAAEFASGALPPASLTKVESHLATCRDCRMLVATLAQDSTDDSEANTRRHEHISASSIAAANAPVAKMFTIGDRVGRYLVLSTLGAGGMGVVFSAYDPQLDRKVALKLLRGNLGVTTKEARTRLRREAQAIAQLSHPNVVGVYDVGTTTDDGDLYIAMEFVEGDTLSSWLKAWPRTWRDILEVFRQAARGLYAAHSVGLLHRDFKPDNVLVGGDGRVRVTDFGLARSLFTGPDQPHSGAAPTMAALSVELTATGTVLGTPRYMPPEQLVGPDIDARSDQFSFCVALYEALYQQHPLPGATAVAMLEKGSCALPPPANTEVPPWVQKIVARGLERDRTKRFQSMAELLTELSPAPVRPKTRVAAFAGAMVLLVAGATGAALKWGTPPAPEKGSEEWAFQQLNEQESEVRKLKAQREHLEEELEKRVVQVDELLKVRKEIDDKNDKLDEAYRQIVTLKAELAKRRATDVAAVPAASHNALISRAVNRSYREVTGCFQEWAERNADKQAQLVVRVVVSGEGVGTDATASVVGGDQEAVSKSRVLNTCAAAAIERVHFPYDESGEDLDVEVTMSWGDNELSMSTGVRHHVNVQDL